MVNEVLIIGAGESLEVAKDICQSNMRCKFVEINTANNYEYDLNALDEYSPDRFLCAVALDSYAINFPRIEVLIKMISKGYKLATIISLKSMISSSAKIQAGVIIGRNVIIKDKVEINHGSIIYPGVTIGSNSVIKAHVSILDNAFVGRDCRIGLGSTIGQRVALSNKTIVGRHCELLKQETYSGEIRDKNYYDSLFHTGMIILN